MTNIENKFEIIECHGILSEEKLKKILQEFPVDFYLVDEQVHPGVAFENHKKEKIDVYHSARVVYLFPPKGKRLSNAHVTNKEFPFEPDNIMDDQLGLRCCYHPKLTSFGIDAIDSWDEIEIDIYKHSKERRWK